MIAFWASWTIYKNCCLIHWSSTDKELKIFASSHFRRYQLLLTQLRTLNSAGIAAFDDIDESKGIWWVVHNNVVHNIWLPDFRAVNDHKTILVWKQSR